MVLRAVRTTVGRERTAIESLEAKLKSKPAGIKAVLSPGEIKGYVFIEGESVDVIKEAIQSLPHIRGMLEKEVTIEGLSEFFSEELKEIKFKVGDLVEVVGGPFKREKAKIVRIDEAKREAKIELVDSAVPIPITIKLDLLKPTK